MPQQPVSPSASAPRRLSVEFVGSFPDPLTRLDPPLAEIAFLGRSNVGKSSLINAVTGRKDVARVSATPGKTQTMNVFRVVGQGSWVVGEQGTRDSGLGTRGSQATAHDARSTTHDVPRTTHHAPPYYLIDLPGYGYAKAAKGNRARFRSLVDRYVSKRPSVTGIVWLLDIRHDPSADDLAMQELLAASERPVLAVLTKADKLGRAAQRTQAGAIARALGLGEDQVELTSSRAGDGIADLRDSITALLGGGEDADAH